MHILLFYLRCISVIQLYLWWILMVWARTRTVSIDRCQQQPSINGLCVSSTLGIYYDIESQRCRYMGCSPDKRLFESLEECHRICNGKKHRRRRVQNNTTTTLNVIKNSKTP